MMSEQISTPVLVSGASGYIACHVIKQLLEKGYKVRGTVRSLKNEKKCAPLKQLCPQAEESLELVEADLLSADTWPDAVEGCEYVIHVASPFPAENPANEDEIIKPAVDGTLNVLKACKDAKTVKRVVLTSSIVAVSSGADDRDNSAYTEENWTNIKEDTSAYTKSKTLAEKAAWDFVKELPEEEKFELAVINPGFVMGPVLCGGWATSMEVPKRLLQREMPMLPKINFSIVDVRDVAASHLVAMTLPEAAGQRHLAAPHTIWMKEMAQLVDKEFKPQGYNVPTTEAPNFLIKVFSLFDKGIRVLVPSLGKCNHYDSNRMQNVLKIPARPIEETIIDMCYAMIENGFIKKTDKYTGPKAKSDQNNEN